MADQANFVNSYIDACMSMLHENLSLIIQLKAQLKIANDLNAQKDQIISNLSNEKENAVASLNNEKNRIAEELQNQLSSKNNIENEYHTMVHRNTELESEMAAVKNKLSHMDTLSNQVSSMKNIIQQKDARIVELEEQLKMIQKKEESEPEKIVQKAKKKLPEITKNITREEDDF